MAYIEIIPEDEAGPDLRELYDRYRAPWGGVDTILKIHSLLPGTLKPHVDLYRTIMFGRGPLTRRQRELVATVVSRSNHCGYCVHHHADALLRVSKDRPLVDAVRAGNDPAGLTDAERLMIVYAEELTLHPGQSPGERVEELKRAGVSEETILHIALVVGYFNFVNRIANGLGVELEGYWRPDGYSDPELPMAHDDR
ncbi:MAG: peroxidase-related enzyme [Ignavibacteria bacterium]|nr:peroxidase-related enzyme [Ignavibacteria bacterium]